LHQGQHSLVNNMTKRIRKLGSVNTQLTLPITGASITARRLKGDNKNCNQLQNLTDATLVVAEYVSAALADNTRLAYQGDLADFIAFGGHIPCSPEQLTKYIADRAQNHSPYTITRRVVGISRAHTSQGMEDPAKNDLVRAVLRGVRRKNAKPQRQVAPLLMCDIFAIVPLMEGPKGIRDRALILLGFAAALRRSELVALDVQDVHFVKEGLILHIRRSKTDQFGEGRKIAVPYGRTSACPVKAVETWLAHGNFVSGPLFRPVAKGGGVGDTRLTGQVVALVLKAYAAAAGLNGADISGHSLRAGLVTSAAMAGVSLWKIKAQSGHKSDAMVARYIRDANLFDGNAAGAVL
jgi:integrase